MKEVLSESHYSNFAEISDAFVGAEKEYGVNANLLGSKLNNKNDLNE